MCSFMVSLSAMTWWSTSPSSLKDLSSRRMDGCRAMGPRCVKPPIIFGDVSRPEPMTVKWSDYARSLTSRPMKGACSQGRSPSCNGPSFATIFRDSKRHGRLLWHFARRCGISRPRAFASSRSMSRRCAKVCRCVTLTGRPISTGRQGVSPGNQWRGERDADSYAHVLLRVRGHSALHRGTRCGRDLDGISAFADGIAGSLPCSRISK